MEQSNALHKLMEAADLVKMLEELTAPGRIERLSSSSLSGLRITLRNIRQSMIESHSTLTAQLVDRSPTQNAERPQANGAREATSQSAIQAQLPTQTAGLSANPNAALTSATAAGLGNPIAKSVLSDSQRVQFARRDLRASIEKIVERSATSSPRD